MVQRPLISSHHTATSSGISTPVKTVFRYTKKPKLFRTQFSCPIEGTAGRFQINIDSGHVRKSISANAIIVSPEALRERPETAGMEDKVNKNVIGLNTLEDMSVSQAQLPSRVVFWLDREAPEWKDNTRRTVLLASDLAEKGREISVIMRNMLVHGAEGQYLYDLAREKRSEIFQDFR